MVGSERVTASANEHKASAFAILITNIAAARHVYRATYRR
jgi:hypothetical protein